MGLSHTVSNGMVGSELNAVIGVISVKKVNVIDGFGLSTSGGIPSSSSTSLRMGSCSWKVSIIVGRKRAEEREGQGEGKGARRNPSCALCSLWQRKESKLVRLVPTRVLYFSAYSIAIRTALRCKSFSTTTPGWGPHGIKRSKAEKKSFEPSSALPGLPSSWLYRTCMLAGDAG